MDISFTVFSQIYVSHISLPYLYSVCLLLQKYSIDISSLVGKGSVIVFFNDLQFISQNISLFSKRSSSVWPLSDMLLAVGDCFKL